MSNEPVNQSRRGFFTGSLLTRDGRQKVEKKVKRLGIFPPGLNLVSSEKHCSDCDAVCAANCPQKIIKIHPDSHQLKDQPYLDFEQNGCTFCNQCFDACPHTDKNEKPQAALGKALLDTEKCYAWLGIICMSCISVCPDQLIKFDKSRKPSIVPDPCTGCGVCIRVCPATAIRIQPLQHKNKS